MGRNPCRRRGLVRWPFAGLLATLLAAVLAGSAWAHASLLRSEPGANTTLDQAPPRVTVWFDEAIEPDYGHLSVYDSQGRRVDALDVEFLPGAEPALTVSLPALPQGSYVVVWRVISLGDGHAVGDAFSFGVGVPPDIGAATAAGQQAETAPDLTTHLIRFLGLLAQLVFVGAVLFQAWAWQPAVAKLMDQDGHRALEPVQRRSLTVLGDILVGMLVIGVLGALYVQARTTGVLFWDLFATRWGLVWLVRAAAAALVAVGLEAFLDGRRPAWQGLALGLVLLLTTTLTSHSSARPGWLAPAADFAHQLGAAVWLGGLVLLALSLVALARSPLEPALRARLAAVWVARFSGLAAAALGVLMVSGLALSLDQVKSWPGLLLTDYGLVLLGKLVVLAAALGLAVYNSVRAGRWAAATDGSGAGRAARWIVAESAAVVAVVFAAAMLTDLPPPTAALADPDRAEASVAFDLEAVEWTATGRIQPARVGSNVFEVALTDAAGRPLAGAEVALTLKAGQGAPETLALIETDAPGVYAGTTSVLNGQGSWQAQLTAGHPDLEGAGSASLELSVGPDNNVRVAAGPLPLRVQAVTWLDHYGRLALSVLALGAAAGWAWVARRALPGLGRAAWLGAAGLWLALVALL